MEKLYLIFKETKSGLIFVQTATLKQIKRFAKDHLVVKLREIVNMRWEIVIKNSQDLDLLLMNLKTTSSIRAYVRPKLKSIKTCGENVEVEPDSMKLRDVI